LKFADFKQKLKGIYKKIGQIETELGRAGDSRPAHLRIPVRGREKKLLTGGARLPVYTKPEGVS
jgi:hypothetical protein